MEAENNKSLQDDEIQALSSIFENEWIVDDIIQNTYSIKISNNQKDTVHLQVTFPENYPLDSPPIYQISAPWMHREAKKNLCLELENIYCQNCGQSIIYLWIEAIRTFINKINEIGNDKNSNHLDEANLSETKILPTTCKENVLFDELPSIEHGEPIVDRKSVFQAHIAKIVSESQVNQVLQKLKENRKIASATHNIYAYRISQGDTKAVIQDCEDDGETKAGPILLHLLQILDLSDILVVVSRWYGGVHLGPDRFKHINNAARSLLCKLGYITEKSQSTPKKSQKRQNLQL